MFILGAFFISLIVCYGGAQDANCDYVIYVSNGSIETITSPNYPRNYTGGVSCRWIVVCPDRYNCRARCNLNMPETSSCSLDRLYISKTGDSQLTSAEYHCGRGTVNAVSTASRLSFGLVTSTNTTGGTFRCQLTAQRIISPTCNCGYKKTNRIVGGEETKPNEYPMMAGIVSKNDDGIIRCGAVIIDRKYVLTAAHCLTDRQKDELAVVVGEHNVSTGADSPDLQVFLVSKVLIHPDYNDTTNDNDIAIIRINGSIVYSENVGPVCLPFKYTRYDFTGSTVTILGWGITEPGGPRSRVLRKADVEVVSQQSCRRSFPSLTRRQICTFAPRKDACQYDSGGPLLYTDSNNGRLFNLGVVSYGRSCASNYPGVNTRITSFLKWIVTRAPANYCVIY